MICQLVVNPQTGKPLDEGTLKKHFPREIAVGAAELSLINEHRHYRAPI
jgi:hypothetical protein